MFRLYKLEMIFYINHFSLIIFYHSVWLGFELFGLRVQVHCHWVQFYARAQRIWQSPFVIINPRKEMGWSVDDVMPRRDGPENLRILKKSQLRVEIGLWRQTVEFLPLGHGVESLGIRPLSRRVEFWPLKDVVRIFGSLLTEVLNITGCTSRCGGGSIGWSS